MKIVIRVIVFFINLDKIVDLQHKNNKNYYRHVDFMLMFVNDNINLHWKRMLIDECIYLHMCLIYVSIDVFPINWIRCMNLFFSQDRPWILPWIKSISNELPAIIHVIASQLSGHCHQQSIVTSSAECKPSESDTGVDVWRSSFLSSFIDSLCHARNKINAGDLRPYRAHYDVTVIVVSLVYQYRMISPYSMSSTRFSGGCNTL